MIDRVHFENFKSLKNVTVELGRLTVLVGPNGCGKSSVLQGIHLLSQTGVSHPADPHSRLKEIFAGSRDPERLASPGRPTTVKLAMRASGGDEFALGIRVLDPAVGAADKFTVSIDGPAGSSSTTFQTGVRGRSTEETIASYSEEVLKGLTSDAAVELGQRPALDDPRVTQFDSTMFLRLDANKMAQTSVSKDVRPRMESDGSLLASELAWMKGAAEDELAQVTRDLGRVVPGVKRIRTLRERVPQRRMEKIDVEGQPVWRPVNETVVSDRFEIDFDSGPPIPSDLLSEGTVLALGLLTKLHEPERPRLMLLDDIDRGLHIEAQARLVEVLRRLMQDDPELQIVCTTHSPDLLDLFKPDEVRVFALDGNRHTQVLPLMAHPEFNKWKFGTQTGELWAALGSAWVTAPVEPSK